MEQITLYTAKIDAFLAKYPSIFQYEKLTEIEKKLGHSKVYIFLFALLLISTLTYLIGGPKLISDLIAFLYPSYMTFKCLESSGTSSGDVNDDTQWLTYWVVLSSFTLVEQTLSPLISFIPFYFFVKLGFLVWLYHPVTLGAGTIYAGVIRPNIVKFVDVGKAVGNEKKTE